MAADRRRPRKTEPAADASAIVEPATGLAIVGQSQVLQRRAVGPEFVRDANMRVTMPLYGFPKESQCSFAISAFRQIAVEDLAFVVDRSPELVLDAVDLHEDLIQMPSPVGQGPHAIDPLSPDLGGEHRAKSVPPKAHGFMANLDAPLVQQVFEVAQRKRVPNIEHHGQADDLRARLEVSKRGVLGHLGTVGRVLPSLKHVCSHKTVRLH